MIPIVLKELCWAQGLRDESALAEPSWSFWSHLVNSLKKLCAGGQHLWFGCTEQTPRVRGAGGNLPEEVWKAEMFASHNKDRARGTFQAAGRVRANV